MAAAVEVEQRRKGGGLGLISVCIGFSDLLQGAVEAVDVGLVVVLVVELHDLARDVGLEGAVVIWERA